MERRSATAGRSSDPTRRRFFDRPAEQLARALLGADLAVRSGRVTRTARIVETEAYLADDPASHAFGGLTRRNRSMFARPGTLYIYRIHQVVCANVVARHREAVLLRAGRVAGPDPTVASGPGRLCRYLGLTIDDDGRDLVDDVRVRLLARPAVTRRVLVAPRVGIRKAADRLLRFALADEPAVSRPRPKAASGVGRVPRRVTVTSVSSSRSRGVAASRRIRTTHRRPSAGGRSGGRIGGR